MENCHGLYLVVYLGRKEPDIFRELAIHSITSLGIVDLLIILRFLLPINTIQNSQMPSSDIE